MALLLVVAAGAACENDGPAKAPPEARPAAPAVSARARLVQVRGKVSLKRIAGDDWKDASPGLELYPGDKVRTERGAKGTVQFLDGSAVVLDEDSLIGIGESRTHQIRGSEVTVLKGRIDAALDDATRQSLTVSTPSATVRAGREIVFQ